ncbi:MAG: GNAT family N-acetyltransferase [Hymenobacteraceae bacterium]|nr:GNAT family N-acetyltransferase [Hymenobacteraceae bacterium]
MPSAAAAVPFLLETPHQRLRDINPTTYTASFVALNADSEVNALHRRRRGCVSGGRGSVFRRAPRAVRPRGHGRWAVELRATGALLGWCGFCRPEADTDAPDIDLGYRFFRQYWGHRYATEAAQACVAYGFDVLALPRIIVQYRAGKRGLAGGGR